MVCVLFPLTASNVFLSKLTIPLIFRITLDSRIWWSLVISITCYCLQLTCFNVVSQNYKFLVALQWHIFGIGTHLYTSPFGGGCDLECDYLWEFLRKVDRLFFKYGDIMSFGVNKGKEQICERTNILHLLFTESYDDSTHFDLPSGP